MDLFVLRKVLTAIVLPPNGPLILALLGLLLLPRRPMLGRALAWLGFLTLLALSMPIVSGTLSRMVNDSQPLDFASASNAEAIVILGGGIRRNAVEYGGDTVSRSTLERVRYGALVARRTRLPVLATGGVVFSGTAEATVMKQVLEDEFGIKVRWTEIQSRNTHQSALRSAEILRKAGIHRVILVTHSVDVPRARLEFTAAGVEVIPAPTLISHGTFDSLLDLVPSVGSLQQSYTALYELLALAVYSVGI